MRDRLIREIEQTLWRALAATDQRDARKLVIRARYLARTRFVEPHELDPELLARIARHRAPERPKYHPVPWAHGRPATAYANRDAARARHRSKRRNRR